MIVWNEKDEARLDAIDQRARALEYDDRSDVRALTNDVFWLLRLVDQATDE